MKSDQAQAGNPVADFKRCAAWGRGGQYVFDPVTKIRMAGGVTSDSSTSEIPPEPVDAKAVATTLANSKQKGK